VPSVLWLGGRKGIQTVKKQWWGAGMVICLERGADLHMAQLMLLLLTVSCFSKIQIGFIFLIPAHPGSPRQRAVKWACVHSSFISLLVAFVSLINSECLIFCLLPWRGDVVVSTLHHIYVDTPLFISVV